MKTDRLARAILILSLLALTLPYNSHAAETSKKRPKIALVLGGGGARGAAHIGVLKVLEANRVPVDYVVGASMGAVVGGGYATGSSPEDLETLFINTNWKDLFSDRPTRENLSFRHKEEDRVLVNFELGVKDWKLKLPQGMIAGQKVDFMLRSMSLSTTGITDFDKLPIPFRAVATDIETGDSVILSSGDLTDAVRASMAIPGVFTPVEMDGKILIDGGFTKNLPVDVAEGFKPDVVIAVSVTVPLAKRDKLDSLITIYNQLMDIMTLQNVRQQIALLRPNDILIEPDLDNISTSDFEKVGEAIKCGETSANKLLDRLKKYSISKEEYAEYLAKQRLIETPHIMIDSIEIAPADRIVKKRIEARIKTRAGTMLNPKKLQKDLDSIYEIGAFEKVDFKIRKEDGKNDLIIQTKEKSWGPNYLRFGLNIEDDFDGDSYYNVLAQYTMSELNRLGGEWRNRVQVGRTLKYETDFYQPLDWLGMFFIDPRFLVQQNMMDVYNGKNRIAEYRVRSVSGGADAGVNIGTYARGSFGVVMGNYKANTSVGDESLPAYNINNTALTANLAYDQLDDTNFPKHGALADLHLYMAQKFAGGDNYNKLQFHGVKAMTLKRHTLILALDGGSNLGGEIPFYDEFELGGFLWLSGYKTYQLRGQNYGLGRAVYYYRITNMPSKFVDGIYVGGSLESGNTWSNKHAFNFGKLLLSGSVFIGIDTILGPIYLSYGLAQKSDNDGQFYLHVGQIF